MTLIAFNHFSTAHEVLFMRRVTEQYPEVFEDEIQGWLSSVRKRKDCQFGFHQSMVNPCTSKYTTRQHKLEEYKEMTMPTKQATW